MIERPRSARVRDAALAYAAARRRVVPVGRDKRPYFKNWLALATTDPEQIAAWWTKYTDANIVTPTGSAAGFFVLDVDPRNGGDASFESLEREHRALSPTLTCATGGGGWHFYFKTPSFVVRSTVLAPGIDVLAEGRAVTLPPSIHASGAVYHWVGAVRDLSAAPAWLLERVRPVAPRPYAAASVPIATSDRYAVRALEYEADSVRNAAEGTRNNTLNASSFKIGQLVGAELLDESDAVSVLVDAALACGLDEREAIPTIRSGLRAGIARPRTAAARRTP
jgi:hypothetical protein